ncbi:hypothetical protein M758_11G044400 [Ceratodon purpureus]|nr:hypothetical protein M758_11G044400 [Ceratodon purpureus]
MAAPNESGYGVGVKEDAKTVDVDEVKRQVPKVVETVGEENGTDAGPEDEQVAKKARVEKVEDVEPVEAVEGAPVVEKEGEGEAVEGVNGEEAVEEGGVEVENGAAEEENGAKEVKDVAPGDGGLRTLLQEGEDVKTTSVGSHGADATHMLNGAK